MLSLFRRRKADPKQLLMQALGDGFALPAFPAGVMKTLQLLRDPQSGTTGIARSVEANPGLLIHVMKTVNSAAFGMRRTIGSATQAVTLLGRARLESLVVAIAVSDRLPKRGGLHFRADRFWRAAARRAALARGLADLLHPQTGSESFVAGLLQDMALPLLATVRAEHYAPLLEHWHADAEAELEQMERAEFGWDHGEIGASMALTWELPEGLARSIDAHHAAESDVEPAVHLVSYLRETEERPGVDQLVSVCRDRFNLAADDVSAAVTRAFEDADALARQFC